MTRLEVSVASALLWCAFAAVAAGAESALTMDRLRVQRKEVFEFTEKPRVTRAGDTITIAFAVKDFCDATVAIEDGKRVKCHCGSQSRFALDYFARSFLPEVDRYSVLVIDANNNEIARIGRYGNVDDGVPLIAEGGPPNPRALGGDEVGIMHAQMLAVESGRRLFIGDLGNACIRSVKLGYHVEDKTLLKDAARTGQ